MGRWVWRMGAVVLLSGCVPTAHSGPRPLPSGPQAVTVARVQAAARQFYQRIYVDAFATNGNHSAPWSPQAEALVHAAVACWANSSDRAAAKAFDQAVVALLDSAADDPLVCMLVGLRLQEVSDRRAGRWLRRAVAGLPGSRYSAQAMFLAPPALFTEQEAQQPAAGPSPAGGGRRALADDPSLWPTTQDLLRRAFEEPVRQPVELRFVLRRTERAGFDQTNTRRALVPILARARRADPWYGHVVRGRIAVADAWAARGSGYGNTVTRAGWEGFSRHLRAARRELEAAYQLHPDLPEAPTAMIEVAMAGYAGRWDTPRRWFDRAVAAQFEYPLAYRCLSRALMPRWGGSHEQMMALARDCLATQRFDTTVPLEYFHTVRLIAEDDELPATWHDPTVRQELDTMCAGLVNAPEHQSERRRWELIWADVLSMCQRYREAYPLVAEPIEVADVGWLASTLDIDAVLVVGLIRALGGPDDTARQAERALAAGDLRQALARYQVVREQTKDKCIGHWLDVRQGAVRSQLAAAGGAAAPESVARGQLIPASSLDGWESAEGTWRRRDDGTIEGQVPRGQVGRLGVPGLLPPNCRVRVVAQCGADRGAGFGLEYGVPQGATTTASTIHLRWPGPQGQPATSADTVDVDQPRFEVVLELRDGVPSATVNGREVAAPPLRGGATGAPWRLWLAVPPGAPVVVAKLRVDPL